MDIPFTREQFFQVFARYNEAVWPIQLVLFGLSLLIVALAFRSRGRWIAGGLAMLWAWMGLAYHWAVFTSINPAAWMFGALFLLQAIALLVVGVWRAGLAFRVRTDRFGIAGGVLVIYALVAYPLIGRALGHIYPAAPTFGLPCPTTIFTFGVFLWAERRLPLVVLVVPALWSLLGFSAAASLGVPEDYGLLVAGVVGTAMIIWKNGRRDGAKREDVPIPA